MWILYILFVIFCCGITAYLVEKHIANSLMAKDKAFFELFDKLSDYISENKKQIQENTRVTNTLTKEVFKNN